MSSKKEKRSFSSLSLFLFIGIPALFLMIVFFVVLGPLLGFNVGESAKNMVSSVVSVDGKEEAFQARIEELEEELLRVEEQLVSLESEWSDRVSEMQELEQEDAGEVEQGDTEEATQTNASMSEVIKTYEGMSSKRAAAILSEMEDDQAYEHLSNMKPALRAQIIGRLDESKASTFMQRMANEAP
ncbi:MotE family protein [Shouchella shacheensis]|uniref:MotE family protein n=1 Tax=Shouchella shacheensis TaxID=1649580 RepID=UPI00073FB3BB|nr:hypothetical protein [Shouchella shacheensis]